MSDNVVDLIREKTGEENLEQILKTSMGGYTKKSVQEYLSQMKQQQQATAAYFNRDFQNMLEEKEKLAAENASLTTKLSKVEANYRDLSETMAAYRVDDGDFTMDDILQLKGALHALEKDMNEALVRIRQNEQDLAHDKIRLADKSAEVEKAQQEAKMYQEMLRTARLQNGELSNQISALSSQLTEAQGETQFLKGIVSDGNVAALNNRITELLQTIAQMQSVVDASKQESENLCSRLARLEEQECANRETIAHLQASLARELQQNQKLEGANDALYTQLKESLDKTIRLSCEKSGLHIDNAVLARKLDAARLQSTLNAMGQADTAAQADAADVEVPPAASAQE